MWTIVLQIYFSPLVSSLCLLLFSVPFCYKFRGRKYFVVRVLESVLCEQLILFALSVAATVLLDYVFTFDTVYTEWVRVLLNLICFLLFISILEFCFDEHTVQIMYVAAAGTALNLIFSSVYSLLINATGSNSLFNFLIATPDSPVDMYSAIFYFSSLVLVFAVGFFFFGRPFARMYEEYGRTINVYMLLLFVVILFVVMFFQGNNLVFYNESRTIHNIFHCFIILFCLTILIVQRFMLYWIRDNRTAEAAKSFTENYKRQTELLQRNMELVNIKCHDLKHQIRGILNGQNIDGRYVDEVQKAIAIYDTHISTGNEGLDVLLTEKSLACELNGIELSVMIDGASLAFMEPSDVNSFFGNALDNATEYLISSESRENRFIRLSSHKKGGFLSVRVENYCSRPPEIDGQGFPVTTKKDKSNHGFGVRSMKSVAERYGGVLMYKCENSLFVMAALFPEGRSDVK